MKFRVFFSGCAHPRYRFGGARDELRDTTVPSLGSDEVKTRNFIIENVENGVGTEKDEEVVAHVIMGK